MFNYQRFYFSTANIQLFFYLFITCTSFFIAYCIALTNLQIGKSTNKKSRYFPATTFPH